MGDEVCGGGRIFVEGDGGGVTQISLIDTDYTDCILEMMTHAMPETLNLEP